MQGALGAVSVIDVLGGLAASGATGGLSVEDDCGVEASVHLDDGCVRAIAIPGRRLRLDARLLSRGALGAEELARVRAAQHGELAERPLADLLVQLGRLEPAVITEFITEEIYDAACALTRWTSGRWSFRAGERCSDAFAPRLPVTVLVEEVCRRGERAAAMSELVPGPLAVPRLCATWQDVPGQALDAVAWALLCRVDGVRCIADLAGECGLTAFETGELVYRLVQGGLLAVAEQCALPQPPPADDEGTCAVSVLPIDDEQERASAVALLAEMMNDAPPIVDDARPGPEPEPAQSEPAHPEPDVARPEQSQSALTVPDPSLASFSGGGELIDVASLLRELSSLGVEDEAGPPPDHRPATRLAPVRLASVAQKNKRHKGLFGRG